MAETAPKAPQARFSEVTITKSALRALAEVCSLRCGPLSLLARLEAINQPADAAGLRGFLEDLTTPFSALSPALLDPHLTAGLAVSDGQTQVIGQYAWADAAGLQPGFKLVVQDDCVGIAGPVSPQDVCAGLQALLQLGTVPEPLPTRLDLTADQFWALMAVADAGTMTAAARRAAHVTGPVAGVRWSEILVSWQRSMQNADIGWATTLAAGLLPDALPQGGVDNLRQTLDQMEEAGLLVLLDGDSPDDPVGDLYILSEFLEDVCGTLGNGAILFGFTVQRMVSPAEVQRAVAMGWRTFGGIIVADLTHLPDNSVSFLRVGPSALGELLTVLFDPGDLEQILANEPQPAYTREALLQALAAPQTPITSATAVEGAAAAACSACGHAVSSSARFCKTCGAPLQR